MSADIKRPDQPQSGGLSSLERVFGFTDLSFRRYMTMNSTRHISPVELSRLSFEMSGHSHPIIMVG